MIRGREGKGREGKGREGEGTGSGSGSGFIVVKKLPNAALYERQKHSTGLIVFGLKDECFYTWQVSSDFEKFRATLG